jgi:hypothetical protein
VRVKAQAPEHPVTGPHGQICLKFANPGREKMFKESPLHNSGIPNVI